MISFWLNEAKSCHLDRILTFSRTGADLVSAFTMNCVEGATGLALAAATAGIPAVIEASKDLSSGRMRRLNPTKNWTQVISWIQETGRRLADYTGS